MRAIGLVTTHLAKGGAEQQLIQIAEDLSDFGERVFVLSFMPPTAHLQRLKSRNISLDTLDMKRGMRGIRFGTIAKYRHWVRFREIELGIFFNYHPVLVGRLSWKLGLIPKVISSIRDEWMGDESEFRSRRKRLAFTDQWCDCNTTNSARVADSLVQKGVFSQERIRVVQNGLDFESFENAGDLRQTTRKELGIDKDDFLWLAAGRLESQKDFENIIKAIANLQNDPSDLSNFKPNFKLCIAGEGSMKNYIKQAICKLGISDVCTLLGMRNDMPKLYVAADAFVLSSLHEGSPNVLLESLASGTPVVATNVSGNPEIVQNGKSGWLIPPKDTKALANAMRKMMHQSETSRREMGAAGRAFVKEKFSRKAALDQWLHVISKTGFRFSTTYKTDI